MECVSNKNTFVKYNKNKKHTHTHLSSSAYLDKIYDSLACSRKITPFCSRKDNYLIKLRKYSRTRAVRVPVRARLPTFKRKHADVTLFSLECGSLRPGRRKCTDGKKQFIVNYTRCVHSHRVYVFLFRDQSVSAAGVNRHPGNSNVGRVHFVRLARVTYVKVIEGRASEGVFYAPTGGRKNLPRAIVKTSCRAGYPALYVIQKYRCAVYK